MLDKAEAVEEMDEAEAAEAEVWGESGSGVTKQSPQACS
jgi:hypothetical protein